MATDVVDDQEMREAQRDYLDFLDDDVSLSFITLLWDEMNNHALTTKEPPLLFIWRVCRKHRC